MAYQTGDGRWIVGLGAEGESSYNGFAGWRGCVIQLTADGATEQSVKYLEGLRDYAIAHSALGESIMPPSVNVWVSNNGTTTAVQADDLAVDGENFTICGIKWNGSAWDYTNAGQGGSGGGGGNVVVAHGTVDEITETAADITLDKTVQELLAAEQSRIEVTDSSNGTVFYLSLADKRETTATYDVLQSNGGYIYMVILSIGIDSGEVFCLIFKQTVN